MICHLYIAQNIDTVLYISSQMLNIYIILCIFLQPHLTSYLHFFKACGKSAHNGIISFSTFCQPYWQASRISKSLSKDCCYFEDSRTDLKTCCLSAPLVDGVFSITLLSLKKESILPRSHLLNCKFLHIILPKRTQVVRIDHHSSVLHQKTII